MPSNTRAIIKIEALGKGKKSPSFNYQRRMYAIIRKYTPEVSEGSHNVCYAELTGLRTFFKMSYEEMVKVITKDLEREIGVQFSVTSSTVTAFKSGKRSTKKAKSVSTYKELGTFSSSAVKTTTVGVIINQRNIPSSRKVRLTIPFLGKIA